jgi:prepilin-type processing-associated H-X9-DG protein
MACSNHPRGFTRLDYVLILIVIVAAVMTALLRPAFQQARSGVGRPPCLRNLHQLILAMHNYEGQQGSFPASVTTGDAPPRSWRVDLLPNLNAALPPPNDYHTAEPWDGSHNEAVARRKVAAFRCPQDLSVQDVRQRYYTSYAGVVGPQTFFPEGRSSGNIDDITDGLTSTIALVEAGGRQIVWTEPRDIPFADDSVGVNLQDERTKLPRGVIHSSHQGWGNVAMVDGSTKSLSANIDPAVLKSLLTATGGETIQQNDY